MQRRIVMLFMLLLLASAAPAAAAEVKPFDVKAFEEAQAAGQGVVVDIHATW